MRLPDSGVRNLNRRAALRLLGAVAGVSVMARQSERSGVVGAQGTRFTSENKGQFPEGAVIRLLLKDERPENLGGGAFLWHEHPMISRFVSPPGATMTDGEQLQLMVDEFKAAKADGVGCIFDATHYRRTAQEFQAAKELALRSGLPFGLGGSRDVALDKAWWNEARNKGEERTIEDLVADMVRESVEHRWAALGEIGTSLPMSELDRWYMKAVAKVQLQTNLRIYTHVPPEGCPSCALEQLEFYESQYVDPKHLCIGHVADFQIAQDPGWLTHKAIAKRGAWLGFDSLGAPLEVPSVKNEVTSAQKVKMILQLLDAGYEDQLLFSSDTYQEKTLKANYGAGFSALTRIFLPKLRYAGVSDDVIRKITIDNPRRFFAFVPKPT